MAYQFIHIESVSKNGRDVYRSTNGKKEKVGNTSIKSILGEAARYEGYIEHVENPLPPVIIYGDKENGIEAVQKKLIDWYEETKDARGHKVRVDANALLAGVVSYPPISYNEDNKEYDAKRDSFESDLIEWLKNVYGDDLELVLRHDDEPFKGLNAGKIHYHWHYFCVKKHGQKFDLHPGFLARSEYNISRKDRENMTKEEFLEIFNEGKKAYKDAMIDFQDKFHNELGKNHGLNRIGPMRLRRSRSEQVELEKIVEKELAYPQKVMNEAIKMKTNAISIQTEAERIKKDAKNIKQKAKIDGEKIIYDSKITANKILQDVTVKTEKQIKNAEDLAINIKDSAWKKASEINIAAEKNADSIIKKAHGFLSQFLDKVSELPGGDKVVNWIKSFIKTTDKAEEKDKEEDKNQKGSIKLKKNKKINQNN